ncbi:hypothetical protein [Clostridium sp. KNHs216]|uniref:hypothetical protein n=1 Tax=Clostridium sp. KNHs216 TaxID=1550235 RepID=UPI00114FBF04|nr:hypothetical protein [Clostridium sp. KNHs216]TQI66766.1 hypothetical protein LY85_1439 [Clostridium sp. KNHs216]
MTADEVKNLLKIHYDIPQMIAKKFATIRHYEKEKNKITLPFVNQSGLLGDKGVPGDPRPTWRWRTLHVITTKRLSDAPDGLRNCATLKTGWTLFSSP